MTRFAFMTAPPEQVRKYTPEGVLVLNRLPRGEGVMGAPRPALKLITEGEMTYEIDGQAVTVRAGELLYLDSGSPCIVHSRGEVHGLCVLFPAGESGPMTADEGLLGRHLVLSTRTNELGRALERHARLLFRMPQLGPELATAIVADAQQAVHGALRESTSAMAQLSSTKAATRREIFRRLERARGYLHATPDRIVSLDELSGLAGLSQFHLARQFRLAFGASPAAYHRRLRLEAARSAGWRLSAERELWGDHFGYSSERAFRRAYQREMNGRQH